MNILNYFAKNMHRGTRGLIHSRTKMGHAARDPKKIANFNDHNSGLNMWIQAQLMIFGHGQTAMGTGHDYQHLHLLFGCGNHEMIPR